MHKIVSVIKNIPEKRKEQLIILTAFAFFLFAMLHRLTFSAFSGDEWVEYNVSQMSTLNGDMYHEIRNTFQPPIYNYLMHFWLRINNSMLWFRLFNIFPGLLGGAFLYAAVKKLASYTVAGISIIALASCYRWNFCIQDCSEYAIMLIFLFGALFFYIQCKEKFTWFRMMGILLSCIGSIYSQYGAVFIAVPLLVYFYFDNVFNNYVGLKRKIIISLIYIMSALCFALPLWMFFARYQTSRHHITEYTEGFDLTWIRDIFLELGKMTGWFFRLDSLEIFGILGFAITVCLMALSIWYICKHGLRKAESGLVIVLWSGYILHYILTRAHIYAMVQSGQSEGFYVRYSYFYIPLLSVIIPVLLYRLWREELKSKSMIIFALGACTVCVVVSFSSLMDNWHKTKDDIYTEIWLDNSGWKDTTFLLGMAKYGFNYYVSNSDRYFDGIKDNIIPWPDEKYEDVVPYSLMPLRFWLWRTEWNGDFWQLMVDMAGKYGYDVTVYDDDGYSQLAYCAYDGEPLRLNSENINLYIVQADFEDDNLITIQSHIADNNTFNEGNYFRLASRIYDKNKNAITQYKDMIETGTWVTGANYYYSINTEELGSDYYIGINLVGYGGEVLRDGDALVHVSEGHIAIE